MKTFKVYLCLLFSSFSKFLLKKFFKNNDEAESAQKKLLRLF